MFVLVSAYLVLCSVLGENEVNEELVCVLFALLECGDQNQRVALNVQTVLLYRIGGRHDILYPIPPVPELHRNLLIFCPSVVEMRVPLGVEGIVVFSWFLPVDGVDCLDEGMCLEIVVI